MECETCQNKPAKYMCQCMGISLCEDCFREHIEVFPDEDHSEKITIDTRSPEQLLDEYDVEPDDSELQEQAAEKINRVNSNISRFQQLRQELKQMIDRTLNPLVHHALEYRRCLEEIRITDIFALEASEIRDWQFEVPRDFTDQVEKTLQPLRQMDTLPRLSNTILSQKMYSMENNHLHIYPLEGNSKNLAMDFESDLFSIVQLPDDKCFMVGCIKRGFDLIPKCYEVNEANSKYREMPEFRVSRMFHSSVHYDGKIYVIGGTDKNGNPLKDVETFDLDFQDWNYGPQLMYPRSNCGVCIHQGKLYVAGGTDIDIIEVLDIKNREFRGIQLNHVLDKSCRLVSCYDHILVLSKNQCSRIRENELEFLFNEDFSHVNFNSNPVIHVDKLFYLKHYSDSPDEQTKIMGKDIHLLSRFSSIN